MHCRWWSTTLGDALQVINWMWCTQVMHRRWYTTGEALQVMHNWCAPPQSMHCRRWCTAGDKPKVIYPSDTPQVMHSKCCIPGDAAKVMHRDPIQDQSDTSDPCCGSVGFGVYNCSGFLVVPSSISESRTGYWVLFRIWFTWSLGALWAPTSSSL